MDRSFLFLQGPHGPFFRQLADKLADAGCAVHRIAFNAGDAHYWGSAATLTPFQGTPDQWEDTLAAFFDEKGVTDIVLYGDTRDIHVTAIQMARRRGIAVHCFEEGYLRPYWITYERNGVNGNSRLMHTDVAEMAARLRAHPREVSDAPAQWGALFHHIYYGAAYHFHVMALNRAYRNFQPHRDLTVRREWALYLKRMAFYPIGLIQRRLEQRALRRSGANYHLVLLQLAHDSSFKKHSDFKDIAEFIELCVSGFAKGAPKHHRLVFKPHPLEDGRENLPGLIRDAARRHGIAKRVQIIHGGKLGEMLDNATTAVTVNSTAGQQVLWRGLPLVARGRSVYSKPEFVSHQPMDEFFANPRKPDREAYLTYRQFLLETSQFPGGFYKQSGRADALRTVVEVMLSGEDPYDTLGTRPAAPKPQLTTNQP